MISPCSVCGVTLTHDHDPRAVLCAGCERDKFMEAHPHLVKPPTTERRRKLPPPPPMRTPYQHPGSEVFGLFVVIVTALVIGFFLGWIARGGV